MQQSIKSINLSNNYPALATVTACSHASSLAFTSFWSGFSSDRKTFFSASDLNRSTQGFRKQPNFGIKTWLVSLKWFEGSIKKHTIFNPFLDVSSNGSNDFKRDSGLDCRLWLQTWVHFFVIPGGANKIQRHVASICVDESGSYQVWKVFNEIRKIDDCWDHASSDETTCQSDCHLRSRHTSSLDCHHHGLWICSVELPNDLAMGHWCSTLKATWVPNVYIEERWLRMFGFLLL